MIDWTKPIEHVDGTPLVLSGHVPNPDIAGDYYAVREDGQPLTYEQCHPYGERDVTYTSCLIVKPNGGGWHFGGGKPVQIVRNRATKQETATMKTITVKFTDSTRSVYAYKTDIADIAVGDTVVVDSPSNGMVCVQVVSVDETAETLSKARKWVVAKVDTAAHFKRLEDEKRREAILVKLELLQAKMNEQQRFASLAAVNPEAAAMIAELQSLA